MYYRWKLYSILQVRFLSFNDCSSTHSDKISVEEGFVFMSTVKYFFGRVKHQANGEQMTLECLRMALCGVRLLLIHTSMVLMMMVMKRRKRKRAARKAA